MHKNLYHILLVKVYKPEKENLCRILGDMKTKLARVMI